MSDQMNPMGPAEPEIMSQDAENVIGLQPGQSDREGAMAKADLYKIANYSHKLFKQINDEDQMEAWVQAKITKAADYIASVYHYLEYEMKFSQYGQALEDSEVYSESQKQAIKNRLMEAKDKVKELKVTQAKKAKDDAADKVSEGVLSGGHKACTECGGSGMVYEEPKAVPAHVKGKVDAYKRLTKATHAAHKRMDANGDGVVSKEEEEASKGVAEEFTDKSKTGDTFKTRTGHATKTDKGLEHTNTSYKDDGDELDSIAKSGKGTKSHAKAQSAAEKKDRAPAQKQSPKSAKTWGMKDSEKFDNRDGAPAKPKKAKEEELDEGKKKGDGNLANNAKPYDKVTKGDVIAGRLGKDEKGGKAVKEGFPKIQAARKKYGDKGLLDLKNKAEAGASKKTMQATRDKHDKYDESTKTAASAMWKDIKETQAYIAEKSAVAKKDKPTKGNKVADEGNAYGLAVKNTPAGEEIKINGKGTGDIKKESADLTRIKQFLTRLNG